MSLKLLLVDDEFIVLKGLETILLNQKEVQLQITLAHDAIEALEKLPQVKPDVMIADINMPELDGLEMMEEVVRLGYGCRLIILSGHEKVAYLRKAIQLQVYAYMLKPIDKYALINKLKEIAQEKEKQQKEILFKIKMCLQDEKLAEEDLLATSEIKVLLPEPYTAIISCSKSEQALAKMQQGLRQYFNTLYLVNEEQPVFLLNYPMKLTYDELQSICDEVVGVTCVGICLHTSNLLDRQEDPVKTLYHLHLRALINRIGKNLRLSPPQLAKVDTIFQTPNAFIFTQQSLGDNQRIEEQSSHLQAKAYTIGELYLKFFVELVARYSMQNQIDLAAPMLLKLYEDQCQKCTDYKAITNEVAKLRGILDDKTTSKQPTQCIGKVEEVCRFIKKHYVEDLTLEQVAAVVQLNPSYLSGLFKKEKGISFLTYLHQVRIEKGCALIHSF